MKKQRLIAGKWQSHRVPTEGFLGQDQTIRTLSVEGIAKRNMRSFFQLVGLFLVIVSTADCRAGDVAPSKASSTQKGSVAVEPIDRPPVPSAPPSTGRGINTPPAKVPAEPVRKKGSVTPADGKQASPPSLDLPSLEKRLRETEAIGLFTKITLKNQVDDLVNQFREYHRKPGETSLAELRQRYDMLLLKLLSLLQDSDPSLAHTILASRDTIWGILTDPVKFTTI